MPDTETSTVEKKLDVVACLLGLQLRGVTDVGEIALALTGMGLGQSEIANVLGTKPKAIENALYKARKKAK